MSSILDQRMPLFDAWTSHHIELSVARSGTGWLRRRISLEGWSTVGRVGNVNFPTWAAGAAYWRGWNKYLQLYYEVGAALESSGIDPGPNPGVELSWLDWDTSTQQWRARLFWELSGVRIRIGPDDDYSRTSIDGSALGFPLADPDTGELEVDGGQLLSTTSPLLGTWCPRHHSWSLEHDREIAQRVSASPYDQRAVSSVVWGVSDTLTTRIQAVPARDIYRLRAWDLPCGGWSSQARREQYTGGSLEQWLPWAAAALPQREPVPRPAVTTSGTPYDVATAGRPVIAYLGADRLPSWSGSAYVPIQTPRPPDLDATPAPIDGLWPAHESPQVRHLVLREGQSLVSCVSQIDGSGRYHEVALSWHDVTPLPIQQQWIDEVNYAPRTGAGWGDY